MVWNPKLAVGVAVILWAPCLLKKGSFYIIGKQTNGLLCSPLYVLLSDTCTLFCFGKQKLHSIILLNDLYNVSQNIISHQIHFLSNIYICLYTTKQDFGNIIFIFFRYFVCYECKHILIKSKIKSFQKLSLIPQL